MSGFYTFEVLIFLLQWGGTLIRRSLGQPRRVGDAERGVKNAVRRAQLAPWNVRRRSIIFQLGEEHRVLDSCKHSTTYPNLSRSTGCCPR